MTEIVELIYTSKISTIYFTDYSQTMVPVLSATWRWRLQCYPACCNDKRNFVNQPFIFWF